MSNETGRELIIGALRHEPVSRVPWVPFAGVNAGKLKGYTAAEVLTDGRKLLESLLAVNELYNPDGQPVLFDLQIEAEILGCQLKWAEDSPPAVLTHPLANGAAIPETLPQETDGRLPMVLDVMREMKRAVGQHTALYGLVTGPFTLASHLRGTEIFMDVVLNQEYLQALMAYTTSVAVRMIDFYVAAGMDVIAVVDPVISQIGPKHFTEFCSVPFATLFAHTRQLGAYSSFFVCGDATKNLEVMCQTNPDSISIDENIDIVAAKEITDRYNITIGGNLPLTTVMLLGTQQDNMNYVVDLLDKIDGRNFILAPGCDMPYDTPVENVVGVAEAVREPETARKLLAGYEAADMAVDVALPDYENLARPLVEVFTLDSDSCAACMYMLVAAQKGVAELGGEQVDLTEYKFTKWENIARAKKLGVENLPSIYINGQLHFSSLIPSQEALIAAIKGYLV